MPRLMERLKLPAVIFVPAILFGYQAVNGRGERLLDAGFVNALVLLMIVTCALGPLLTERFGSRLPERADTSLL
jgi:hypothetical protein